MNAADIVILALVIVAAVIAVYKIRKNKGRCSCGCSDCPESRNCRNK